jgi:hypothetical protein
MEKEKERGDFKAQMKNCSSSVAWNCSRIVVEIVVEKSVTLLL